MGGKINIKKDKQKKVLKADEPKSAKAIYKENKMAFSFLHLSKDQGASFDDWNNEGVLLKALDRMKEYSNKRIFDKDGAYTIYGDFPPNSGFTHPKNVPTDANWARIHINGKYVIAGHVINNIFYVVFLDSNHKFWITEK